MPKPYRQFWKTTFSTHRKRSARLLSEYFLIIFIFFDTSLKALLQQELFCAFFFFSFPVEQILERLGKAKPWPIGKSQLSELQELMGNDIRMVGFSSFLVLMFWKEEMTSQECPSDVTDAVSAEPQYPTAALWTCRVIPFGSNLLLHSVSFWGSEVL